MLPLPVTSVREQFTKVEKSTRIDLLNYYYSASLFACFAFVTSAKQYMGQPIQCWVPVNWRSGWEEFVEDYCFATSTAHVPDDANITETSFKLNYYQWVPPIFLLMSCALYMPSFLLRANFNDIAMKCVYLANILLQMLLVSILLGFNYFAWNFKDGFPVLTVCEVPVRQLAHDAYAASERVQCVLMVNVVNKVLFAIAWFWLVATFVLTALSLVTRVLLESINRVNLSRI